MEEARARQLLGDALTDDLLVKLGRPFFNVVVNWLITHTVLQGIDRAVVGDDVVRQRLQHVLRINRRPILGAAAVMLGTVYDSAVDSLGMPSPLFV